MEEKKETKWNQIEEYFATEVVEQAKRATKRWFAAWVITFVALIISNFVWLYVFQSYDYVSQDGSGVNTYETDINGDLNGAED